MRDRRDVRVWAVTGDASSVPSEGTLSSGRVLDFRREL